MLSTFCSILFNQKKLTPNIATRKTNSNKDCKEQTIVSRVSSCQEIKRHTKVPAAASPIQFLEYSVVGGIALPYGHLRRLQRSGNRRGGSKYLNFNQAPGKMFGLVDEWIITLFGEKKKLSKNRTVGKRAHPPLFVGFILERGNWTEKAG